MIEVLNITANQAKSRSLEDLFELKNNALALPRTDLDSLQFPAGEISETQSEDFGDSRICRSQQGQTPSLISLKDENSLVE